MAEPKQDTVRVALPQSPETTRGPQNDDARHETAQIRLPSRAPAIPPRRSPPPSPASTVPRAESPPIPLRRPPALPPQATASPLLHPLPKPVGAPSTPSQAETNLLPRVDVAAINMKKTPSLITRPAIIVQPAPVIVAPSNAIDAFDSIPRWFCWGLLGISALIFLTQIWNYALS